MNYKCILIVSLVAASSVAYGDPTPVSSAYVGTNRTIQVNGQVGYQTEGGGGEFYGTLSGSSLAVVPTFFWCVDDQEAFYWGESRQANVTLLSAIGNNNDQVRYGQVSNTTANHWTNTSLLPDAAALRYELAAYLVTQYVGFDVAHPTISNSTTAIQNQNDAIQKAIWSITNTTTPVGGAIYETGYSNSGGYTGADSTIQNDQVAYWIGKAKDNYTNITAGNWAVVSWGAAANGALNSGRYDAADSANQTFLVELDAVTTRASVTPEPGFYGALTVGFSGLVFAIRRRNKV